MKFDHPFVLILFAVFIPIIIFDFIKIRSRHKLSKKLEEKLRASVLFFRLFLAFAIIALSGPRWGTGYTVNEYRRGLDTVFAIDVSRSMDIRDVQISGGFQSRLQRGISIAQECIVKVNGARFAAAIGRSRGYLAVPLTYDNEAAVSFLSALDGSSMTGRSTNLESLVEVAANAFQSTSAARKTIVLISDGESHSGSLRNAINRCARDGITIYAVAAGSDEGRPVPLPSGNGDLQATEAISRRDAAVMRTAAERTGGVYIDAGREDAANVLASHLLSLAQETGAGSGRKEQKQRRAFFIILALIAYGASKFAPLIPRLPLFQFIFPLFFLLSCTDGKLLLVEANYLHSRGRYDEAVAVYTEALKHKEAAPYAQYGLALTFYSMDEEDAALKRYGDSQKLLENFMENEHRELHYRNHYNSGIILFEQGEFHSAASEFKEALKAEPGKIDAKRNLELALLSISMEEDREKQAESHTEQKEILFEYLRQEEQQRWKSREWTEETNNGEPDY